MTSGTPLLRFRHTDSFTACCETLFTHACRQTDSADLVTSFTLSEVLTNDDDFGTLDGDVRASSCRRSAAAPSRTRTVRWSTGRCLRRRGRGTTTTSVKTVSISPSATGAAVNDHCQPRRRLTAAHARSASNLPL